VLSAQKERGISSPPPEFPESTLAPASRGVYPRGMALPTLGDPMAMGIEQSVFDICNRTLAN